MHRSLILASVWLAATAGDPGAILRSLPPPAGMGPALEIAVYPADSLWKAIDGAAESYIDYGVVETATVAFARPGASLPSVTIDLHWMADPAGAFGVFSAERSERGEDAGVGSGSSWQNGMLAFWKGNAYARIVSEVSRDSTILIARELADRLPAGPDTLPELALFPTRDRLPRRDAYTARSFDGVKRLDDVWTATYRDSLGAYRLLLRRNRPPIRPDNLPDGAKILTNPTDKNPIQLIDLGKERVLILIYVKGAHYLAGYDGRHPGEGRLKMIGNWVEGLPTMQLTR